MRQCFRQQNHEAAMSDFGEGFFAAGLIGLFAVAIGCIGVAGCTNMNWRAEAVDKGHAEYYLDGSEAKWRWKDLTNKEQP
jgi:hypothetical protein